MAVVVNGKISNSEVIKYVKATNSVQDISEGTVYPVIAEYASEYRVYDDAEDSYNYAKMHFVDATEHEYVAQLKFITILDEKYAKDNGLVYGKDYIVHKEDSVDYFIENESGDFQWHRKAGFKVVDRTAILATSDKEEPLSYDELVKEGFKLLHEVKYKSLATIVGTKNTKAINALVNEINTIENYLQ